MGPEAVNAAGRERAEPFEVARRRMVEEQLVARGIRDARVLEAMAAVPRHRFVDPAFESRAYGDHALPTAEGQTISQPWIVARTLELSRLEPSHRVLEVGTGSGYQTAILARLVEKVYSVERIASLVRAARRLLDDLGVTNAVLRHGDGSLGWQEFEPYARVLAAAAAPRVPDAWFEQLADGGLVVVPVGDTELQHLEVWRLSGGRRTVERHDACRFVPLIGRDAWPGTPRDI